MSEHPVNGWFVTTRDLIGSLALVVTVVSGILIFFLSREARSATVETITAENTKRIDTLEQVVRAQDEKYAVIQGQLSVIATLLEGKKKPNGQ